MRTLALALALALVVASPLASAATADIRLVETEGGIWNGVSTVLLAPGDGPVLVWVPAGARVQDVNATSWSAAGPDALRLVPDAGATEAAVRFDYAPPKLQLARVVAPQDYDRLDILVRPLGDDEVVSPDAEFLHIIESDPMERWRLVQLFPAPAGTSVSIRVVDADRVGELPILLTLATLALALLASAVAWHRARPPLAGRAPERFLDHLSELQARLLPLAVAFAFLNVFYFASGLRAIELRGVPLVAPTLGVEHGLAARAFEAFAERLVPAGVELVALRPAEAVLAQVQMGLFLATATVTPLLLYELGAFLGPALLPRERRVARFTLPLVAALLLSGAIFGYLVMAPLMIRTLYSYAPGLGATPLVAIGDLVSFALIVIVAFAVAFQLPVAMYALSRLGIVAAATFRRYVRHAIVAIVLIAGILTPDPSVVSQLLVAAPVTLLYLVGMAASAVGERKRATWAAGLAPS